MLSITNPCKLPKPVAACVRATLGMSEMHRIAAAGDQRRRHEVDEIACFIRTAGEKAVTSLKLWRFARPWKAAAFGRGRQRTITRPILLPSPSVPRGGPGRGAYRCFTTVALLMCSGSVTVIRTTSPLLAENGPTTARPWLVAGMATTYRKPVGNNDGSSRMSVVEFPATDPT